MGRHLKRYHIPESWPLPKKAKVWVIKPRAGPHKIKNSIPLTILIRDVLKFAKTGKEANKIIKAGSVLVDKKARKDPKYPVGLMDVVEIPEAKKQFRVFVGNAGLFLKDISEKETSDKLCKIKNKITIKGGLHQLNLHDGRNIITKSNEFKPGDTVKIALPDQSIEEHLKFVAGSHALIFDGNNKGEEGKIVDISNAKTLVSKNTVTLDIKGKKLETLKDYVFVIGAEKAAKHKGD